MNTETKSPFPHWPVYPHRIACRDLSRHQTAKVLWWLRRNLPQTRYPSPGRERVGDRYSAWHMIDDVTDPTCDNYIIEISFMNDHDYMFFMLTFCDMNVQSYADYMRDWHQAMEPAFGQSRDDTELFDLDTSNG